MARLVIHPGEMRSQRDGDMHYIGSGQLRELYQLTNEEYGRAVVLSRHSDEYTYRERPDDIHLYPRYDGDYRRFWED